MFDFGKTKKLGLAMSGGTIRGCAHIGVLKVLEKNRIPVHFLTGVSAGSIVSALYASGLSSMQIEKIATKIKWHKIVSFTLSNRGLNLLSQAVSGHGLFRGHLGKWKEDIDPTCILCGEEVETSWHLWADCPALGLERMEVSSRDTNNELDSITRLVVFFQCNKISKLMKSALSSDDSEEESE